MKKVNYYHLGAIAVMFFTMSSLSTLVGENVLIKHFSAKHFIAVVLCLIATYWFGYLAGKKSSKTYSEEELIEATKYGYNYQIDYPGDDAESVVKAFKRYRSYKKEKK